VTIHQDAPVYAALLDGAETATQSLAPGRRLYVHVARGEVTANGQKLLAGDALKATGESAIRLEAGRNSEVIVFDLP